MIVNAHHGVCDHAGCNVKVARVVRLKLTFIEWFFYNLVILIKLYKIRYLNLNKAFEKPGYLSEKLKI